MNLIDKINGFLLLLLLFVLPFPTRWLYFPAALNGGFWEYGSASVFGAEILLGLILILIIITTLGRKDFFSHLRHNWKNNNTNLKNIILVGFIIFLILEILGARRSGLAFNYLEYVLEAAALGFVIIIVKLPWQKKLAAFWLGGVVQALLAIAQFCRQSAVADKWLGMAAHLPTDLGASVIESGGMRILRAYGALPSPNALGIYLAVVLLFGVILYLNYKSLSERFILSAGQTILIFGLLVSFSRGAWLGFLVGFIFLAVVIWKQGSKEKKERLGRVVLITMLSIIIGGAVLWPVFQVRLEATGRLETRSIMERVNGLADWAQIQESSKFVGVGPGNYTLALFEIFSSRPAWQYEPVHNIYLLIWAEWGMLGLILLFFLIWRGLNFLARANLAAWAPILAVLVFGLFDHWIVSLFGGLIFTGAVWALAFVWGLDCLPKRE